MAGKAFDPADCRCDLCHQLARRLGGWGAARVASRHLRRRGWAGSYDALELAFLRAHPPRWWVQQRGIAQYRFERAFRAFVYGVDY